MTLVVLAVTAVGLYFAQRKVAAETEHDLQRDFQAELALLHSVQEVRRAALAERTRALVSRPRIHAALEDNALDLLYLNARDELRDVIAAETGAAVADPAAGEPAGASVLRARFYRFLNGDGAVISPPDTENVGALSPDAEARLALPGGAPDKQQIGYFLRKIPKGGDGKGASEIIDEVVAVPIKSSESGEPIAALVLGFPPAELDAQQHAGHEMLNGVWIDGQLHLPELGQTPQKVVCDTVTRVLRDSSTGAGDTAAAAEGSCDSEIDGVRHRLFYKRLNPGSLYPAAYEICLYPLTELLARQQQLRWQAGIACALLLLGGVAASHFLSGRLSQPVEKLAVDSEENRMQRARAEAALELTSVELQRAARFSADASHQLKTPITVLRAGLEELLAQENLSPEACDEVSALVHQTYRLTGIVEDLLLLSRLDAGRLKLDLRPVDLSQLIEALLDDLAAVPDGIQLDTETEIPPALHIAGEKRYTELILQNLLENARKYNLPDGCIRVTAEERDDWILVSVCNKGRPIPQDVQSHIFERFHRGSAGENIPGHGLGLNLARELARIHGGDLRLARSDEEWTEFEVRFRPARQPAATAAIFQNA